MEKEMITTKFQGLKTKRICGKYFSHLKLILSWQRWQLWSNMIYTPTHTQVYLKAHESMAPVSTGSENSIQVIKKDLAKSLFQKALKVKVLVAQACLAVWDSINCSLPGSSVHGILQARILKWIANSFSRVLVGLDLYQTEKGQAILLKLHIFSAITRLSLCAPYSPEFSWSSPLDASLFRSLSSYFLPVWSLPLALCSKAVSSQWVLSD